MKNKINNSNYYDIDCYFGVDFSGSHLRLLQTKVSGKNFDVVGWLQRKMPKGVVKQGEIIKKVDFVEILKEALENAHGNFSGNEVVLSIPEEKVFTRVIQVPLKAVEKSFEETIKWETESSIPVSIDDIYYDWQVIKDNGDRAEVLVMATTKDIIDNYLSVFDEAGLSVVAIEPESLALSRSIIADKSMGYVLLVDLGTDFSNFVICKDGLPVFTSSSSVSSRKMTEIVVREFGFGFEKAENYKIKKGLEDKKNIGKSKKNIFESILNDLVEETKNTIDFLRDNLFLEEKDKKIQKIILCGGGSNLKGLSSYLTVKLKIPVIQSNPWINLNFVKKIPPISKQESQGFASVIGLTLRSHVGKKND